MALISFPFWLVVTANPQTRDREHRACNFGCFKGGLKASLGTVGGIEAVIVLTLRCHIPSTIYYIPYTIDDPEIAGRVAGGEVPGRRTRDVQQPELSAGPSSAKKASFGMGHLRNTTVVRDEYR